VIGLDIVEQDEDNERELRLTMQADGRVCITIRPVSGHPRFPQATILLPFGDLEDIVRTLAIRNNVTEPKAIPVVPDLPE